jgi:hypothetical protein
MLTFNDTEFEEMLERRSAVIIAGLAGSAAGCPKARERPRLWAW